MENNNAKNTATTGLFSAFSAHTYTGVIYGATGILADFNSTAFSGNTVDVQT